MCFPDELFVFSKFNDDVKFRQCCELTSCFRKRRLANRSTWSSRHVLKPCNDHKGELLLPSIDPSLLFWCERHVSLTGILEDHQKQSLSIFNLLCDYRNLLGEDLGPLSIKELEQLERQLDASLRQIRSTRVMFSLLIEVVRSDAW